MNRKKLISAALAGLALFATAYALRDPQSTDEERAPLPQGAVSAADILFAQRFHLERGYVHQWRADAPLVTSGTILVLAVDPSVVEPRQTYEPVLYAGDQTAERVNHGHRSGRLLALVPDTDAGSAFERLPELPIWFGSPALPEEVTPAILARERAAAERQGVRAFPDEVVTRAREAGGPEPVRFARRLDLERHLAGLLDVYSPEDEDLVRGLLLPEVR